ncbi:hypothetical protein [Longimicrobium terrae]|uniref:Uncharacterized protein n=1 Tax=Longimicrobium terrae TaxID=1639882 RepID=A0A841H3W7_9BACT|nr:hypothetical protein [Longimicrobium terrae]MBB4638336.1 hypothetical protein [Longimicrobium terrae]MBB6072596.1 hypothetical protein [Longimicrobium terrae]NNC28625.1 hypothetical protein [Longimicrobium terrae]
MNRGARSHPAADAATGVHDAVIASAWRGPGPAQVEDSTPVFILPAQPLPPMIQRQIAALPDGLAQRLAAISATRTPSAALPLPAGTALVDSGESRRIQEEGYGGAVMLAVSPVAFSDDSTHALVYLEQHCGPVCGSGKVVWLARDSRGRWRVRGEVVTTMQ